MKKAKPAKDIDEYIARFPDVHQMKTPPMWTVACWVCRASTTSSS
jgi:hypothetical protein